MIRKMALAAFAVMALMAGPIAEATAATVYNASRWSGVAIEGTDAVAYFTQAKPVEGSRKFSAKWNGATWRFASAGNRDLFVASPTKYAPQFGGWCAWAVSQGYTASIDPDAWRIVDGKLYLNYSKSVQAQWAEDIPGNIEKGETNWPGISKSLHN